MCINYVHIPLVVFTPEVADQCGVGFRKAGICEAE
jgi:hypothetical protein